MIRGINHLTFVVKNLDISSRFFQEIFDAKQVYDSGDNFHSKYKERFFLIGKIWIALMENDEFLPKTYNHVAFKIKKSDFDSYLQKIENLGLEIISRKRIKGEAESIYFYDHDNHLFELHTGNLNSRLKKYNLLATK